MNTVKAELTRFESAKDLKPILGVEGPCVTLYLPLAPGTPNQTAKANELVWRELIHSIEPKAQEFVPAGRQLLEPLSDFDALLPEGTPEGQSLAVFRSADLFRVAWLDERVASRAVIGPHFFVRPMLQGLSAGKTFYILALSQKNVRLLRCTMHSSEEIPFPESTATNFDDYMATAKPDHTLDNRASGGPDMGAGAVMFGTAADSVDRDQYLAHFYRQIDNGLNEVLHDTKDPVEIGRASCRERV